MPTPEQILEDLRRIANEWRSFAVLWHVYFGVFAAVLAVGFRPSRRAAGVVLGLPLFSVSALAWMTGNPFNGTLFALAGLGLIAISARMGSAPVRIGTLWSAVAGVLLFLFGWFYPHFLDAPSSLTYAYAAPTGLIPCPTLSIVIGVALMVSGLDSRPWSLLAGTTGLFYGLFGAVRLGVGIDWFLVAGSVAILVFAGQSAGWLNPATLDVRLQSRKYRACIIAATGQGDYGHSLHMVFGLRPDVEIVGLADPDETARRARAAEAGAARTHADYREMLRHPQTHRLSRRSSGLFTTYRLGWTAPRS